MLNDAVLEGQGRHAPERGVRVEVPVSAYIPGDYVALEAAKIDLHRRIGLAEDLDRVAAPARAPSWRTASARCRRRSTPFWRSSGEIQARDAGASQLALRGGRVTDRAREPHQPGPARASAGHAERDLRRARAHRVAAGRRGAVRAAGGRRGGARRARRRVGARGLTGPVPEKPVPMP